MSDRREFIGAAAALVAGLGVACESASEADGSAGAASGGGSSGGTTASGGAPSSGGADSYGGFGGVGACAAGIDAVITTPHPHSLSIPDEDAGRLDGGYYTIAGEDHSHGLSVSATDFEALRAGQVVELTSGEGGYGVPHTHAVTLSCS